MEMSEEDRKKFLEKYGKFLNPDTEKEMEKMLSKKFMEKKPLKDLEPKEQIFDREVLIMNKVSERSYPMCPICRKRYPDNEVGSKINCVSNYCKGAEVELVEGKSVTYTASDSTGGAILIIGTETVDVNRNLEGYVAKVSGSVGTRKLNNYPQFPVIFVKKIVLDYNIFDQETLKSFEKEEEKREEVKVEEKKEEWYTSLESLFALFQNKVSDKIIRDWLKLQNLSEKDVGKYVVKNSDGTWSLKQ